MRSQIDTEEPTNFEPNTEQETEVDALNNNKVDVDIEPDVKSNDVVLQICSCSLSCVFNCFSGNRPSTEK